MLQAVGMQLEAVRLSGSSNTVCCSLGIPNLLQACTTSVILRWMTASVPRMSKERETELNCLF